MRLLREDLREANLLTKAGRRLDLGTVRGTAGSHSGHSMRVEPVGEFGRLAGQGGLRSVYGRFEFSVLSMATLVCSIWRRGERSDGSMTHCRR